MLGRIIHAHHEVSATAIQAGTRALSWAIKESSVAPALLAMISRSLETPRDSTFAPCFSDS